MLNHIIRAFQFQYYVLILYLLLLTRIYLPFFTLPPTKVSPVWWVQITNIHVYTQIGIRSLKPRITKRRSNKYSFRARFERRKKYLNRCANCTV